MLKTFFAAVGIFTTSLFILGAFDAGYFRLYFGNDPHGCTAMENKQEPSK